MMLRRLFGGTKPRKYPIKRDEKGQSLRARCFELFDEGERPAEVAKELGMKQSTAKRYFQQWKKLGPNFERKHTFFKELFKETNPDRDDNLNLSATELGIAKDELETLFALNAISYPSLSSAINLDKANESREIPKPILYDELKRIGMRPEVVIDAIAETHPTIEKYLFSGSANRLMLKESEILTSVLLRLKELGIPALPVHDSVIVPSKAKEQVKEAMEHAYWEHTSFIIPVE